MNTIHTIVIGIAAAAFLTSCKEEKVAVAPPTVPTTPVENAKTEAGKAVADAKSSLGHAGAAIKDLAGVAKEKAGVAIEGAKQKLQDFGNNEMNEVSAKLEQGLRDAKAKGGDAWTQVKAAGPAAIAKLQALIASLPEDKKEAAKAKLQQLQDVLDGKQELPAEPEVK